MAQQQPVPHRIRQPSVDIPFDLNKIFKITYEFEPLVEVLEHLFGEIKKNKDGIQGLDNKVSEKFAMLET